MKNNKYNRSIDIVDSWGKMSKMGNIYFEILFKTLKFGRSV